MTDEWEFQTSYKHGPNGSRMTNVRGKSAEEFADNLVKTVDLTPLINDAGTALEALETLASAGFEPTQVEPPQRTNSYTDRRDQRSAPAAGGGGGTPPPNCKHGLPRKWVSGIGKSSGRPFSMWACTVERDPRSPQCEPIFV